MILSVIMVFLIPSIVIIGVNIIKNKIFFGEVDDAINTYNESCRFNPRSSLNKFLNAKMVYYGRLKPIPMRWLVFYSNFFLPTLAALSCYSLISDVVLSKFTGDIHSILYLLYTVANAFNVVTIRGVDKLAFYFNFVPSVILLALVSIPFDGISVFLLVILIPTIGANSYYFIRRSDLFLLSLKRLKKDFNANNDFIATAESAI